jgi:hypothetical protein
MFAQLARVFRRGVTTDAKGRLKLGLDVCLRIRVRARFRGKRR